MPPPSPLVALAIHQGGNCDARGVPATAQLAARPLPALVVAMIEGDGRAGNGKPIQAGGERSQPPALLAAMREICSTAAQALNASGAGMSVMSKDGTHGMATASDPATEWVEQLQFTLGEGPCLDAFTTRRPVLIPDLADGAMARWPAYAPAAYEAGVRAIFAFPMQVGAARLGIIDVFRADSGPLTAKELDTALTLADFAVTVLLDGQDGTRTDDVDGLEGAISNRAELFQAQGMVMVQLGIGLQEAMARIRAHAYAEGRPIMDIASDIVARRLHLEQDSG